MKAKINYKIPITLKISKAEKRLIDRETHTRKIPISKFVKKLLLEEVKKTNVATWPRPRALGIKKVTRKNLYE